MDTFLFLGFVCSATLLKNMYLLLLLLLFLLLQAQGGEFPVVVIPLHRSMARMLLNRTLLYTAATRAKQLLIIVGTEVSRVKQGRQQGEGEGCILQGCRPVGRSRGAG